MSWNNVATFFKMYLFAYKRGNIKNMKGTKEFCNINMFLSVSIYFTHIGLFVLELSCRYKSHGGVSPRHALHHPPFYRILFQRGTVSETGAVLSFFLDRKCDFVHANTFNINSGLQSKLWHRFTLRLGAVSKPELCCERWGVGQNRTEQLEHGHDTQYTFIRPLFPFT